MQISDLIAAFDLPAESLVGQRVPKKLLVENGAPTPADKRRINDGIEEVQWLAALKPTTIGVPEYRNSVREYLEIAVLSAMLRSGSKTDRITELIHRAVPYPVVLLVSQENALNLSLAHKRWSQGETGATVLDGDLVIAEINVDKDPAITQAFTKMLTLENQPRTNLYELYHGWINTVVALLTADVTGELKLVSQEDAELRRAALRDYSRLEAEAVRLWAAAAKERQLARQVELNLELKRVEAQMAAEKDKL